MRGTTNNVMMRIGNQNTSTIFHRPVNISTSSTAAIKNNSLPTKTNSFYEVIYA